MATAIVVTSGKGGVGKTTTTANIGSALALMGKRVCVVDADIGLRNLDLVLGLENRIVYDIVDVVNGICKLKQALIKDKRFENLTLLPAAQTKDKNAVNPEQMSDIINKLKEFNDYVIIDCPAGIEQGFKNAVVAADRAIVVVTPEVSSVRDADRIIGMLEVAEIEDSKLLVNRLRYNMVKKGDMLAVDDIKEILAIDLLGVVPDDEDIVTTTNRGEPAVMKDSSLSGRAFRNIARRIEGEEVEFIDFSAQNTGFLEKFKSLFFRK
ncbi:MAG: septum site-determining protein MinD [Bacillota bacterium]|nr:septum site-determining protein MinD [Bacillota bacterium]